MSSGFDRLARPYRWMEYLSFGRALEHCRFHFIPDLVETRNALLLGDGDGRFAARLLRSAPLAQVHAVDSSTEMLAALKRRCDDAGAGDRVSVYVADLSRDFPGTLQQQRFDLITTHFFLDCLEEEQIEAMVLRLQPLLTNDVRWIVSEFNVPDSAMRGPAKLLVGSLYLAFRILTGMRVRRLPDYQSTFEKLGFQRQCRAFHLGGLLLSEVWRLADPSGSHLHSLESRNDEPVHHETWIGGYAAEQSAAGPETSTGQGRQTRLPAAGQYAYVHEREL